MKKARRIKAGVLAFTAVVSVAVTSVPVYAVEDSPVVYDLKAEQKNQETWSMIRLRWICLSIVIKMILKHGISLWLR